MICRGDLVSPVFFVPGFVYIGMNLIYMVLSIYFFPYTGLTSRPLQLDLL